MFCAWIAFHDNRLSRRPSSFEMFLLFSSMFVLVVFIVELAVVNRYIRRRIEKQAIGLHKQDAELVLLHKRLEKLEIVVNAKKKSPTNIKQTNSSAQIPEQTILNSHFSPSYPHKVSNTPNKELPSVSAAFTNLSEEEVISALQREFSEACRLMNRDARQIINRMQSLIAMNAPSEIRAIRVSRDGAIEESTIYRVDASNIAAPRDSIAVLLGGGRALLFPAPLAGEDSFVDAKAFDCEFPVHLRRRSQLADCLPARLTETSRDVYELLNNGKGTLRFHHV
ncbi:MAG: hypothetical protein B9S30_06740 [Verrucomicrobiia bacterium Tous-C5FEB]|nr:MAG: hypothetical protein B9S30_06740 [Verrucomicrobiae bacterium Tous-C5FEB]